MFKRTSTLAVITAALFSLAFSTAAQAQWGRNDDYRRDRRDDRYGYGRYDSRTLRDAASRIKDRSKDLERDVDRLLDNSRYNGRDREDRHRQPQPQRVRLHRLARSPTAGTA